MKIMTAADMPRICYVHIAKSAGTWLRHVLQDSYRPADICDFRFDNQFDLADPADFMNKKFFSAHVGIETALRLDSDLITVLRNPFDRVLSLFYYWKEVEGGPVLVKNMNLEEFLDTRIRMTTEDLDNGQTWQLAYGNTNIVRKKHSGISKDDLLAKAIENLDRFAILGVYENLDEVTRQIQDRYMLSLGRLPCRINATRSRKSMEQIPIEIRNKIYARNDLDVALYDHVMRKVLSRPPAPVNGAAPDESVQPEA